MFSIVTHYCRNRNTNLNFLLPKMIYMEIIFECYKNQKIITKRGKNEAFTKKI